MVKPGGRVLISVPYGIPGEHGWWRQFDAGMVRALISRLRPASSETTVYRYDAGGWQLSSLEAASEAEYHEAQAGGPPPSDGAAAARAVACLDLVLP